MAKDISSPHDEFFKYFMSQVEVVRTYIENFLPAEITAHLNLDTIVVDIEGYVDDDLKAYFSDVVATRWWCIMAR
jgi:predicted transposase YdaD